LIDYLTGTLLLIAAGSILLNRSARTLVSSLGAWILALVVFIYTPVLFSALAGSNVGGAGGRQPTVPTRVKEDSPEVEGNTGP
jgi:hypothetical protein